MSPDEDQGGHVRVGEWGQVLGCVAHRADDPGLVPAARVVDEPAVQDSHAFGDRAVLRSKSVLVDPGRHDDHPVGGDVEEVIRRDRWSGCAAVRSPGQVGDRDHGLDADAQCPEPLVAAYLAGGPPDEVHQRRHRQRKFLIAHRQHRDPLARPNLTPAPVAHMI